MSKNHSLRGLQGLSRRELAALFDSGRPPTLASFVGSADGLVLTRSIISVLRLWRGKRFNGVSPSGQEITGINRVGIGPKEFSRYSFSGHLATSAFAPREVLVLNHDRGTNPSWVRSFHDEVVEIDAGLYLGCSHVKRHGRLVFAGYFALVLPS